MYNQFLGNFEILMNISLWIPKKEILKMLIESGLVIGNILQIYTRLKKGYFDQILRK